MITLKIEAKTTRGLWEALDNILDCMGDILDPEHDSVGTAAGEYCWEARRGGDDESQCDQRDV